MIYSESEYLQLSGLQHFAFCRRQWALIHVEQQWKENTRTIEGLILHEKTHNDAIWERSKEKITVRGMRVSSAELGISGTCDVVEFIRSTSGAKIRGENGLWKPYPVEYKRGSSKANNADRLQLCAQAICLEEMLGCPVPEGALFYGETRRRERVNIDEALRAQVYQMLSEMHEYFQKGYTPKTKTGKHCNTCSLKAICLPAICRTRSAREYIKGCLGENEQ